MKDVSKIHTVQIQDLCYNESIMVLYGGNVKWTSQCLEQGMHW